jgi:hypothetical protein
MAGKKQQPSPPGKRWHAVMIVPGKGACAASRAQRGKRYLSRTEAPKLPLTDCTRGRECPCTYQHYSDRRGGARRADEAAGFALSHPKQENRQRRGRRDRDFGV